MIESSPQPLDFSGECRVGFRLINDLQNPQTSLGTVREWPHDGLILGETKQSGAYGRQHRYLSIGRIRVVWKYNSHFPGFARGLIFKDASESSS